MSSYRTPLLLALVAVALAAMFYYFFDSEKSKFDWTEASWRKKGYDESNDQPYGSLVAHRLLENYFPGKKLTELRKNIAAELPDSNASPSNYVFVGEALYMDSLSTSRLLQFVAAGNVAFISSKTIPFDLMTFVYFDECYDNGWSDYQSITDSAARMSLRAPQLPENHVVEWFFVKQNKPLGYSWHYIEPWFFCNELPQQPLGYLNDSLINFAEFPYGEGRFLLHTNPIVFSNYSLLRAETRPYVEGVLSHLVEGDIWWDAVSRVPEAVGRRRNDPYRPRGLSEEHPLKFILQQPALAWAWYLLAAMAGAWLLFRAKRRQRVIPILPKNENSSYEFIGTIANLHFREKNYQSLCAQAMRLFLAQIRERYSLVAPMDAASGLPRTDDVFFQKLAAVSEVPEQAARDIFVQHANTVNYQPTEEMMVDLHLAMEAFFKKAK
jgi:hypothetical protein